MPAPGCWPKHEQPHPEADSRRTTRRVPPPTGHLSIRPGGRVEIERSGLFEDIVVRHFDWEIAYGAEEYLALLDTFSDHIAMQTWKRDRLYAEIRWRLEQRTDGRLRRHWGAVLHVARRADQCRFGGADAPA
ncbi:MAG: hypothetical protein ACYDB7_05740 [Mycobacteriales bacterium]